MSVGVEIPIGHALAEKRWAKDLTRVSLVSARMEKLGLVGKDTSTCPIVIRDELEGGAGQQIVYGLVNPVTGVAVLNDDIAEEREYDVDFDSGNMYMGMERFPMKSGGAASEMRVSFDTRKVIRDKIKEWNGVHKEEVFKIKLSGAIGCNAWDTVDSSTIAWDNNSLRTPSTDRIIRAGVLNGTAANQTVAHGFSLTVIDTALQVWGRRNGGTTNRRKIVPLKIDGKDMYILLIDFLADQQIRQQTSGRYYDLQKARITGGAKESPLWENADWQYRNVLVYVCEELVHFDTYGGGGDYSVRNLFMGQQAGLMVNGPGKAGLPTGYFWKERPIDFGNKLGVLSGRIWGFDKCNFTISGASGEDFGVGVIDTYVAGL